MKRNAKEVKTQKEKMEAGMEILMSRSLRATYNRTGTDGKEAFPSDLAKMLEVVVPCSMKVFNNALAWVLKKASDACQKKRTVQSALIRKSRKTNCDKDNSDKA